MLIHYILACVITKQRPTWPQWKSYPTALSTAGDIGSSNMALTYVTVGFYTIVKSSVPLFVLLFAIIFGLERLTTKLFIMISVITIGMVLSVWKNAAFHAFGFFLLLIAVTLSGLRWSLTQLLMAEMKSPLHAMRNLSLVMSVCTLVAALLINPPSFGPIDPDFPIVYVLFSSLFGSLLAFALTLSEFRLLQITSVLTVSIYGIIKEILTIILGLYVEEGQSLSIINIIGLCVCILGILWYHFYRIHPVSEELYSPVQNMFYHDELEHPKRRKSVENHRSPTKSPNAGILRDVKDSLNIYDVEDIEMQDASTQFINKISDEE